MENSLSCPVCNNLCSTQAASCPKCGHPINKINQAVENITPSQAPPSPSTTGSALRVVLWIFFAISLLYAFGIIGILNEMPYSDGGYADTVILKNKIAIAYHIAPLILMIIVLAITYSAKERP
ncbi:MAG TPA: hypothetical protein VGC76_11655 [Pyrinomonadaceae bacterium]|jgi:hypothetical protein